VAARSRGWNLVGVSVAVSLFASSGFVGAGSAPAAGGGLQGVVDGLVSTAFVGEGLTASRDVFLVPGAALTVAPRGRHPRTFVAGQADLGDDAPMRPGLPQPVGSGTKPMTAVLVLSLVEQGRLDLDERLPDVARSHRRDGGRLATVVRAFHSRLRRVTVRELLNMTSGLADYDDSPAFVRAFSRAPRAPRSLARLARYGLARRPLFRPGAPGKTYYSNTGYELLGMVVEAVTGRTYQRELERLFRRAGMRHSSYSARLGGGALVHGYMNPLPEGPGAPPTIRRYAAAFAGAPTLPEQITPASVADVSDAAAASGPTVRVSPAGPADQARYGRPATVTFQDVTRAYDLLGITGAAGGAVSTSEDLARFWRALFGGRLLRSRTLALLRESVPASPNAKGVRNYYGLGVQRQDLVRGVLWRGSPRLRVWMKLGDTFGYTSASYYIEGPVPFDGLVVTNTTNLFPDPVGDLGALAATLRALAR
jgi:CubicO group peptidase (beta-lactamase class C family)